MKDLIQNNTQRPDIIFYCIHATLESLWTHIEGASHIDSLLDARRCPLGKPKISNFSNLIFEQNVGWLEVSVQKARFSNDSEPVDDVSEDRDGLLFR